MSFFLEKSDYLALPRAPEAWVIEDLLPTSGLLNIYGRPKDGKSFISVQAAAAIGDPAVSDFLSFPIRTHGKVAYLQVDTPRGIWADTLTGSFIGGGLKMENFFMADSLMVPYPFNIVAEGGPWLRAACDALQPVVVIVDTLREIHGGDENDSGHMRNVINALVEATTPAALILISHSRKNLPDGAMDLMAENRGSGYVAGRMDGVMKVTPTRLAYRSRTTGEDSLAVRRLEENGLFVLVDKIQEDAKRLARKPGARANLMALSRELQTLHPNQSLDACRSRLRRIVGKPPKSSPGKDGGSTTSRESWEEDQEDLVPIYAE